MPKDARQIPLTIGPLEDHGWLGGTAFNDYIGRKSSYSPNSDGGIDPFRKLGVLQAGFSASVVNSFITTQIVAMKTYSASGTLRLYGYDILGKIFQVDTNNHSNVSVIASLNSVNQDYGFAVMRDYLFATYNPNVSVTKLVRIGPLTTNTLATTINASMVAFVNDFIGNQIKHVIMPWKSNLYCLHANNLDYLDGNGINTGILTQGARLPSGMVVKCAVGYGDRIAIGASDNLGDTQNRGTICRVYFYDGISLDWQKETVFPENDILNLSFNAGQLIGYGRSNFYVYNPSSGGWDINEAMDTTAPTFSGAHDVNQGQVWFTGSNVVRSFGSNSELLPSVMNVPYGAVGSGGVCKWVSNTRLYVSNSVGQLLYLSAGATTGVTYRTKFIEFGGTKFRLAWLRIVTETLTSGDGLTLKAYDVSNNSYTLGTMTFSGDGAIASKEFYAKDFSADMGYVTEMQLGATFDAGNVKIRRIDAIFETAPEY